MRERSLGDPREPGHSFCMALETYPNDEKQASLAIILLSIMSVIIVGLITAAVLSTRACSV
ncbi:MAG TPA: hypothetical protein VMZ53_19605 [Kofleriaceae bacterium]|nr:hypothetical protein [Kofleriaceae bacterium]